MKNRRTMSIDDYLSHIDKTTNQDSNYFKTERLTKIVQTTHRSLLCKLKNENHQKALKLQHLKDLKSTYLSCSGPETQTSQTQVKSILQESINDCESKIQSESIYTEQLRKMSLNMKENIVILNQKSIKIKNSELELSIKQLVSEYEKSIKFTSNAKSWQLAAQSSLYSMYRLTRDTLEDRKKLMTEKKNEQIVLSNFIRNKSEQLNIRENQEKKKTCQKVMFVNNLNFHIENIEKNKKFLDTIKAQLNEFSPSFDLIFQYFTIRKVGYKGRVSDQAADLVIESFKKLMFRDGSLSEQYVQLSQVHHSKVEELSKDLEELKTLIGNFELSRIEAPSSQTFNILRSDLESKRKSVDDCIEKLVLKVYGDTLVVFHRFYVQLRGIEENSEFTESIMRNFKSLELALADLKKQGRRTLFKAMSEQSVSADRRNNLFFNSKLSFEEVIMKHNPENKKIASTTAMFIKESPVVKFMTSLDLLERFVESKHPIKDFLDLVESCFKKLDNNFTHITSICINLLTSLKVKKPNEPLLKTQQSITDLRRNCMHIRSSVSLLPSKPQPQVLPNPKKKLRSLCKDMSNIDCLKQKIEVLRSHHKKATRSSEHLKY